MEFDSCVGRKAERKTRISEARDHSCLQTQQLLEFQEQLKAKRKIPALSRLQMPLQDVLTEGGKKPTCQAETICQACSPLTPSSQAACLTVLRCQVVR